MRRKPVPKPIPYAALVLFVCLGQCMAVQIADAQQDQGEEKLNQAVELKLNATSTRDLDKIADLCEEAIELGLEEDSVAMAKQLWASTLYEYANLLGKRMLDQIPPDRRWRFLRQQAMTRLEKAVELAPDHTDAYLLIARLNIMLEGGDKEVAKDALAKVIDKSSDDPNQRAQSLVLRSQLTEDKQQRLKDLTEALEIDSENAMALQLRGKYFLENENIDGAIEDFRKLAKSQGDNPNTFLLLAQTLAAKQQNEEALQMIAEAIKINPDLTRAYELRASLYMMMDEDEKALQDTTKLLELNPRDIRALMMRANLQYAKKNYDAALKDIDKVLSFQPGTISALHLRSFIYAAKEEFDSAIDDMRLLALNEPDNMQWQNDLAMMYNGAEKPLKAIEIYGQVLDLEADNQRALRGRGDAFLSTGEHTKAVADYNAAMKIDAEDDGVLNNLAWVLATSPDDDVRDGQRSIKLGLKACELTDYKQAHILSTLAAGYAESGDFEKAREWSAKAVEIADAGRQLEDLTKELESYKQDKPWRERNTVDDKKSDNSGSQDEKDSDGDDDGRQDRGDKDDDGR